MRGFREALTAAWTAWRRAGRPEPRGGFTVTAPPMSVGLPRFIPARDFPPPPRWLDTAPAFFFGRVTYDDPPFSAERAERVRRADLLRCTEHPANDR